MRRKKLFFIPVAILIGCTFFLYLLNESSTKYLVADILTKNDKHVEKISAATVVTIDEDVNMKDLSEEEIVELKDILKKVELKKAWRPKNVPDDYILTVSGSNLSFHIDISKNGLLSIYDEDKKEIYKVKL